ncbi:MAG: ABC transporter ATP-binding protein [Synechocystis sp.]|nr:ABC transporter ATP-binding protein [Synechocystis sp.]
MTEYALVVKDLGHVYADGTQALRGISLHIQPGERVALVGANGSGKSTLQRHINGLLSPSHGQVWVHDLPVISPHLAQIRQWVGMVFQNPDDQLFMPTVAEDIAFGLKNFGVPPQDWEAIVHNTLQAVDLDPNKYAHRYPDRLSGGEKKRVAIAGILALKPRILVLDEPTAQLDPRARRQLMALLQTLPTTQIIATHDLDLALDLCDRTLILSQGHLTYDGVTQTVMADETFLHRQGLETPLSFRRPYCDLPNRGGSGLPTH